MKTNITKAVPEEIKESKRGLLKHEVSVENDTEAEHKCQLCKQSFVQRKALDEHVEKCDLFEESKETRNSYSNLKSQELKGSVKEIHDESNKEKYRKPKNGKGFYEVIVKEDISVKCRKDNELDKGEKLHGEKDVIPKTSKKGRNKTAVKKKDANIAVKQTFKNSRIDIEKNADFDANISKSGRKRKIKSFEDYETDLPFIQRPNKRRLVSDTSQTLNISEESKLEGDRLKSGHAIEIKEDGHSHFNDSKTNLFAIFLCPLCNEEDPDIEKIQCHIKLKHNQKQLSWDGSRSEKYGKLTDAFVDPASRGRDEVKECPLCKEHCETSELLKHHVKSKHEGHSYCCGICSLGWASRKAAKLHMKKCYLKLQHTCIDCKQEFRTNKDLVKHNIAVHRKQTQSEKDKAIERNANKHLDGNEVDDAVHDSIVGDETSAEMETQKLVIRNSADVNLCKSQGTSDVLDQTISLKEEKTTFSGPIVIKSARVIPKVETRGETTTGNDTEITGDETNLNKDTKIDFNDSDDDIKESEIASENEDMPVQEEQDDQNVLNIKPRCLLDFSKINGVKYKCCFAYCESVLQSFTAWKKHISSHLTSEKKEAKYVPLQCIECGYSSRLKTVFIQHLLIKHSLLGSVETNLEYCQILDHKTLEPVKVRTCVFCCLTMDSRHFLADHKCYRKKVHFYCPFCEKKDSRFEILQKHIKEVHSDKTIYRQVLGEKFQSLRTSQRDPAFSINSTDTVCSTCKQEFKTNDDLKLHVNELHAVGPFSCGVCRQCYGRYCAVKDHMKKTHSLPMTCKHCKRGFGDKGDLARHEATHLKTKPFKCDLCPARFSDQRGLSTHYRSKHAEYSETKNLDGKEVENSGTESKPETFICDICGLSLHSQSQYKNHAKNHQVVNYDNAKQIRCEICSKLFISRKTYRRHLCMKAVDGSGPVTVKGLSDSVQSVRDIFEQVKQNPTPGTNAVVKCGLCQKDFNKNKYLFNHIRHVHLPNEGKKIHCSICSAGFTRKAQLQCHMRSHLKTKPYLCRICGKRFRQLGHVKVHLLSHSAQSLFKCELCTQFFKTKNTLKNHISKHCDISPYKCFVTSCDRSFVSLNNLLLHVRNCDNNVMPEKSFECKLCSDMKLDDLKSGLAHMKSHSKDAFYKCSICSCDFITYRALYEHKAKLKHFTQSEKENAANQTVHTQNFRSIEVDENIEMKKLQEQYEFTPDSFDSEEIYQAGKPDPSMQAETEKEEDDKMIDSEELMDIAQQLTHMAQRNMLNDENLEVKAYSSDNTCVVESVETVIEDYSEELFVASSVEMSVPTSEYSSQYNTFAVFDDTTVLNANLTNTPQNKSPGRNDNSVEISELNEVQKNDRDLTGQNRGFILDQDDYHIEVIESHPVIDENAVLVSRTSQQKKKLTDDYNTKVFKENDEMVDVRSEVVNGEIQQEKDTVCIEMLTIPTIYDKFGREVKVNVINEDGHEIPFQSNQELLQALLTTGNYSLGYNQSNCATNEITEDRNSFENGSKETMSNLDNLHKTESRTDMDSLNLGCQNDTEIYVINEVQRAEDEVQFNETNKIIASRRGAKKQKPSISSIERNTDNVPGEIIDKDASIGNADNGNVNYKVKLNLYEDRTKNVAMYHLKCSICPRRFSKLKDLNHHKKIHLPNDEKQYQCKDCGKGYISKNSLISHMLTHSGDRPHKCSQCDKCFRQLGHLQTHLRIHINYRPFKCTSCEKTFVTNSQLKAHVKKHGMHLKQGLNNCVPCLICGNSFANEKDLNIHKIKHINVEVQNELIKKL